MFSMFEPDVKPSHLGLTRGDHVSWPIVKTMIPMIMMINILYGHHPLRWLPPHSANLITPNQHGSSDDGGRAHYKVH
jgi:hypothetical protein